MGSITFSVAVILVVSLIPRPTDSLNCYGGQYSNADLIGGNSLDLYVDMTTQNGEVYATGYLYDGPISVNGVIDSSINVINPSDALVSFGGVTGTNTLIGEQTVGYSVATDGQYLVVGGITDYPNTFPATSPYSSPNYIADAFFVVYNITDHSEMYSLVWGDWRDERVSLVAVHAERELVALVTHSIYSGEKRNSWDGEVTIGIFDLKTGENYYNETYGTDEIDYPAAVSFQKVNDHLYLLVAGHTQAQGNGGDGWPIYNATQPTSAGDQDAFVWTMNVDNPEVPIWNFATFFGSDGKDAVDDATFDEEGNVYVVGTASKNLTMLNQIENPCQNDDNCPYLAVFSLTGQLRFSSFLGLNQTYPAAVTVQRLDNGGHLVYIGGSTDNTDSFPGIEEFQYTVAGDNTTIPGVTHADGFLLATYLDPSFTTGEIRLRSRFGGSRWDYISGIGDLPNNNIAVAGYTYSKDFPGTTFDANRTNYDAFVATFHCGSQLTYAPPVSPSPTPSRTPSSTPSPSSSVVPASSSPQVDQSTSKDDAGSNGDNTGPIVGGVLGGVTACSCCFIVAALLYRKKKKEREEKQPPEAQLEL